MPPHMEEDVPGTILLYDPNNENASSTHRRGDIVLQPAPSADPEDPLRWSQRRKHVAVGMVYLYTFAIGIATACQYSILTPISEAQDISVADLNLGTGLMQLMQGWGCLLWQPIALTYGRRCVYILTITLSIGPIVWTPLSHGPGQWYAARILLGILCCPVECLPELSVQDLFYAHERGRYMAIYAFVLFGSNFLAPFFAGFINDGAGWQWVMWFATIVMGVAAVIMFFFLEETIFFRATTEGMSAMNPSGKSIEDETEHKEGTVTAIEDARLSTSSTSRKTFLQRLNIITLLPGRPTKKQMLLNPWLSLKILILFPNILWTALLYGSSISWYSVINATISSILSGKPYNFEPWLVGVCYLSPLVFALLAALWAGHFADAVAFRLTKRNNGVREPEYRLWTLIVPAVSATAGLLMWGVGASYGVHYMVLVIGIGITTFGVICASAVALSYAVDCFKEIAGESFAAILALRNTWGFAFSYAITPWIKGVGLRDCFITVAMLSLVCYSSFLLMIWQGKNFRRMSATRYWRYVTAERQSGIHQ